MCFQVLGFDVMIDKLFKPWLIEVNQSPSFATDSPLDYEVKKNVLKDAFSLLNVNQERREKFIKERNEQLADRVFQGKSVKLFGAERDKLKEEKVEERVLYERMKLNEGSGFELIHPVLDEDKQLEYDMLIKNSQRIFDDFTTGKNKKKDII